MTHNLVKMEPFAKQTHSKFALEIDDKAFQVD
jgi:hypothetical protein